jgi:hypothetical protein
MKRMLGIEANTGPDGQELTPGLEAEAGASSEPGGRWGEAGREGEEGPGKEKKGVRFGISKDVDDMKKQMAELAQALQALGVQLPPSIEVSLCRRGVRFLGRNRRPPLGNRVGCVCGFSRWRGLAVFGAGVRVSRFRVSGF